MSVNFAKAKNGEMRAALSSLFNHRLVTHKLSG